MNQSNRRTFSLRMPQHNGIKYFQFKRKHRISLKAKQQEQKKRQMLLKSNRVSQVKKKSRYVKVNIQELSSSIRSFSNNSKRNDAQEKLKYFKNFQKNNKNKKLIQKLQQTRKKQRQIELSSFIKKNKQNLQLMGLQKRIQSRLRGEKISSSKTIKQSKMSLKKKINLRVESFFAKKASPSRRQNINHSRIRSEFPESQSPKIKFQNNSSYSYKHSQDTSLAKDRFASKNQSTSPLRTSQSTKAIKQQIIRVQKHNFAKIKSNRETKKEETFTEYFNFKEPYGLQQKYQKHQKHQKKSKEVKFIRKTNLIQKKAQNVKYRSKVYGKQKRVNGVKNSFKKAKMKAKVEFKLSLRGIISEKLRMKKKILLRTKLKEKKRQMKVKEKFLMRRKDTNQILCERLNYLKKRIGKKGESTNKKLKKSSEKPHFLMGNAKFLQHVKEPAYPFEKKKHRKKIRIQRFLNNKQKENISPNCQQQPRKVQIKKTVKATKNNAKKPPKCKDSYFITQRNSKQHQRSENQIISQKINNYVNDESSHFDQKSKDTFVKSESTCYTGLGSTPLECEETLGYSHNTLSSSNSRGGYSTFLSGGPKIKKDTKDKKGVQTKKIDVKKVNKEVKLKSKVQKKQKKKKKVVKCLKGTKEKQVQLKEELIEFDNMENIQIDSEVIVLMIKTEKNYAPDAHYFNHLQPHLNWLMRGILLNWLTEVCVDFMFKRDTYYLAVNYIDRYLSKKPGVKKWQLQLVGTTALYIAQKMEEVEPQRVKQFSTATDDGYTVEQIKSMELTMLKVLPQNFFLIFLANEMVLSTTDNKHLDQLVHIPVGHLHHPKQPKNQ